MRKKKITKMQNISRVDQERKNQHGWLVRVMRDGINHQKFFSDSIFGSKLSSLLAAQKHRDELLHKYPKPEHGNVFNKITARNTSGYPGISKSGSYRKGEYYRAWQVQWTLPNGKLVSRKFGFSPWGRSEKEALELAIKARQEALAAIERGKRKAKRNQQPLSR